MAARPLHFLSALLALGTLASPGMAPAQDDPQYRDRPEAREAYRRGYENGFERGYEKGRLEGERRAPAAVPAPPPPAPPRQGPIHVIGATYGDGSRSCDATRWVSHRANGKRVDSFEVVNGICGDPAPGHRKTLEVKYRCGEIVRDASAVEHRTLTLDCKL